MLDLLLPTLLLLGGGFHAAYRLRRAYTVHLIDITIWMTCLVFGTGPWIAVVFGGKLPDYPAWASLEVYAAIFLFLIGLALAGVLTTSRANRRAVVEGTVPTGSLMLLLYQGAGASMLIVLGFFVCGVLFKIYAGFTWGVFVAGDQASKSVSVSYGVSAAYVVALMALRASFLCALLWLFQRPRRATVIPIIIVAGTFLLDFTVGRRALIADTFLITLCWMMLRGMNLKWFFGLVFLMALLGYFAIPFFWNVRYYYQRLGNTTNSVSRFVTATGSAFTDWDKTAREAAYKQNMASRPISTGLNYLLAERLQSNSPTYGEATWNSAVMVVPYVLFPGKRDVPTPEETLVMRFQLPDIDMADNWPAYAMADFGWVFGPVLFGLLLGGLMTGLQYFAVWIGWRFPYTAMCLLAVGYEAAVSVETTPVSLFANLRNVMLFLPVALLLLPFVRRKIPRGLQPAAMVPAPGEPGEEEPFAHAPAHDPLGWGERTAQQW